MSRETPCPRRSPARAAHRASRSHGGIAMGKSRFLLALCLVSSVAIAQPHRAPTLDSLARDYVALSMQLQRSNPDVVSVTEPPAALAARAKGRVSTEGAVRRLNAIVAKIDRLRAPSDPLVAMRQRSLRAHAVSLALQLH